MTPEQMEDIALAAANDGYEHDEPGWWVGLKPWVAFWLVVVAGTLWAIAEIAMARVWG